MNATTTLNDIWQHSPCKRGWLMLLKNLGKYEPDAERLPLLTVLQSNGLQDALWCLRTLDRADRECRLYAVWCGRQVQHLLSDERLVEAINVAERFALGEASIEQLTGARQAILDSQAESPYYSLPGWQSDAYMTVSVACWRRAWFSPPHAARYSTAAYAGASRAKIREQHRDAFDVMSNAATIPCSLDAFDKAQAEIEVKQTDKFIEMFCSA